MGSVGNLRVWVSRVCRIRCLSNSLSTADTGHVGMTVCQGSLYVIAKDSAMTVSDPE